MLPEDFMHQVPLWVIASMTKQVMLKADFAGPCETYAAGAVGTLVGIMFDGSDDMVRRYGPIYALVALDPDDDSYMENFSFDAIMPMTNKIKFSLNIEEGIIAF